ncbi:hypothetical protein BJX70DRAFT_383716 [Aspergillus crustosus]
MRSFQVSIGNHAVTVTLSPWPGCVYETVTLQKLKSIASAPGVLAGRPSGMWEVKLVINSAPTDVTSTPKAVGGLKFAG